MNSETDFRFDGGATWLNLLATQGQSFGARPIERLRSPSDLHSWLALVGMEPSDQVTARDLAKAISLREALRDLAMSAVEGHEPSARAEDCVNSTIIAGRNADPGLSRLQAREKTRIPVSAALAAVSIQAVVSLRGPDRGYLTECGESDCRWVFLDPSKRRRWCPSPACASRGRVRAHRARIGTAEPTTEAAS